MGMSGNFLSCSKGVKDPLEVPEVRCGYSRDASVEMGLMSPGMERLLDIPEFQQVLSSYDGRGITRGPLATRMITGLSGGRKSGSLNPRRN